MTTDPGEASVWINLDVLVVKNRGAAIATHPTLGRVVVATQNLGPELLFQPIVREIPALICPQQDYMNYLDQFLGKPESIQMGIFDMFYQPLDSHMGRNLLEPARILYVLDLIEDADFTVIHQLLSILETNGHQYRNGCSALPLFGSKFQHSCAPNLGYCYEDEASKVIDYILLKPLQKGELLSHSYLTDLFETPTPERRNLLMETKDFLCACHRCQGPDFLRCFACPTCTTRIPCQYTQSAENQAETYQEFWECSNCGLLESGSFLVLEQKYTELLNTIEQSIEQKTNTQNTAEYSPYILQDLVTICSSELSPTHHLTIKALRLLVTSATASGYVKLQKLMARGQPLHSSFKYFRMSVVAGFQLVQAGECVAAGCCSSSLGACQHNHSPQFDRASVVKDVYENFMQLPVFYWPPQAATMILRYAPIIQARYGKGVMRLGVLLDQTCLVCGTDWNPYAHQMEVVDSMT